jgi:hypothetical protein
MRPCAAGLALLLLATRPALASAEAPLDDAVVSARLAFVESVLAREEASMLTWRDGWLGAFSGLALLQVALGAGTNDTAVRGTAIVGGTKSLLAAASILVIPSTAVTVTSALLGSSARTPSARRARLTLAESLLARIAREERFRRSWMPLVAGAFLNLGGATVMWAGYHRAFSGWFGLGSGLVVGQLYYQTQPTGAITAWAAYTKARAEGAALPTAVLAPKEPAIRWSLAPGAGGLVLRGAF